MSIEPSLPDPIIEFLDAASKRDVDNLTTTFSESAIVNEKHAIIVAL